MLWAARRDGDHIDGIDSWLLCALALAAGLCLNSLQGLIPDVLSRAVGNTLMVASVTLAWQGARELRGIPVGRAPLLTVVIATAAWNIALLYVWSTPR